MYRHVKTELFEYLFHIFRVVSWLLCSKLELFASRVGIANDKGMASFLELELVLLR